MIKKVSNFGGNVKFSPAATERPECVDELLGILTKHKGQEIRAVGSLHSWSPASATTGVMLEMQNLNSIEISREGESTFVTVGAGCKIKQLVKHLAGHGLALPSLGLIDEQTIAGATATGTHGSGKNSLSHYIEAVSLAHYNEVSGESQVSVVDSGQELKAARCSLGLMGVIFSLKLRCRQRYNIEEHAQAHDSVESALAQESGYPQQQFYLMPWSWRTFAHHRVETQSKRSKLAWLYRAYCFLVIDIGLHVVIFGLAKLLRLSWPVRFFYKRILPLTIVRNWKVVDDSHSILVMEHELFQHIEIEVFVQRSQLEQATKLLVELICCFGGRPFNNLELAESLLNGIGRWDDLERHRGAYVHHYPICYRRILQDETLISMASPGHCKDEDWYAISLISYQWSGDRQGFFEFAKFVALSFADLFNGRCHWGKHNPLDQKTNEALYPMIDEFRGIIRKFDSSSVFKNDWLRTFF